MGNQESSSFEFELSRPLTIQANSTGKTISMTAILVGSGVTKASLPGWRVRPFGLPDTLKIDQPRKRVGSWSCPNDYQATSG